MPEGDAFDRWIADFRRDVDSALDGAAPPALATKEAQQAQEAFDQWWTAEQKPVTDPGPRFDLSALDGPARRAPAPARESPEGRETFLPQEWPARLEKLADERARLQQRAEAAELECRQTRERLASVQSEIAAFEAKLSRSRAAYEDHIARLEDEARRSQAQLQDLRETKGTLDGALKRAQDDQKAAHDQLALERSRADAAEGQLLESRRRAAETEAKLSQQGLDLASQAGALEELRRQASVYQQRLVQSKELTDSDIMTLRQDLKMFLEELRLTRGSIRKQERGEGA